MKAAIVLFGLLAFVSATVYFKEEFGDGWENRWVVSKNKGADAGKLEVTAGKFYGDEEISKGLRTTQDAKFYQISANFDEFSNKGKTLVIQYTVKHEQKIDCGGGYLKIGGAGLDQENFNGDSEYNVMFGPDICGSSTRKTHVIFAHGGKNHLVTKNIKCETDELSHLYTLIVRPDNTYEVQIDGGKVESGSLEEDFGILPPKEIPDPDAKKPADWVDNAEMDDPEDVKPADWDDQPAEIADPNAVKPDDWDDELDGEWEAPQIQNPEHKGAWKARKIPNPAYKGAWVHPKIANPEYKSDSELYAYPSFGYVGIEIWQVKSGTIFDNIIITDSIEEAAKFADETWKATKDEEKASLDRQEAERKKKDEEEAAKRLEEEEEEAEEEVEAEDELKDEL